MNRLLTALFICLTGTTICAQNLKPFKDNTGKYGYKDGNGKETIQPKYDNAEYFSEGLASVAINSKWGFVDTAGKDVIQPKYDNVSRFSGGFCQD